MTTRNELAEQRAGRLPDADRQLFESFRQLGMDPAAALAATQGRDTLPSTDPYEELTESFESAGLSREGAKLAAAGRQSAEHEIREVLRTSSGPDTTATTVETRDLSARLSRDEQDFRDSLTDQERDQLSEAAQQLADAHGLARTYGCDSRKVAERWLLKAAYERMKQRGEIRLVVRGAR